MFGFVHPWTAEKEQKTILQSDAWGYHMLARNMLEHQSFKIRMEGVPNSIRTPLYPMFIAGVYTVFGYKPWIVLALQIVLDTLACLLLFLALFRLFDYRVALTASFFYAIDPLLIVYSSSTLLTDTSFLVLVVIAFYWFSLAYGAESGRKRGLHYGLSGLFLGLATLCRPVSQFLPVVFVIFFFIYYRKRVKEAFRYSAVFVVVFALTLLPWLIRNNKTFGRFALSAASYQNMLVGYVAPMEMIKRKKSFVTVKAALIAEAEEHMITDGREPDKMDDFERGHYYRELAFRYIKSNPLLFGKTYAYGIFYLFANLNTKVISEKLEIPMHEANLKGTHNFIDLVKNYLKKKGAAGLLMAAIIVPIFLITYLGAVWGFFVSWKKYDTYIIVLCVVIIGYFVGLTGVKGLARFKMPAIPFYLAFTGIGLTHLLFKLFPGKGHNKVPGTFLQGK